MTTISSSLPLSRYLSNAAQTASSSPAKSADTTTQSDALAQLRSYAQQLVSNSQGGLLRAYQAQQGGSLSAHSAASPSSSQASQIALPDVAELDRDDAAKLMGQLDKLLASEQAAALKFVGFNAGQQTDSLSTYRSWLQEKGGISLRV
ncbi:hypothetical protein [Pseudomonas sp. 5P_3.1_Bac2]|uniref:hypothetical protein n=1 Tax=Pseudomonas sp. 5P_3.1_Bac2 TaxID=2971617 RepID=UPI0021CA0D87|nr:hypothetical protein [Pseudomonas sp. 5P_3.1_Bac2]MCU1716417.1 hypothetical protein [Pseudomonas sp. 5P_3.1_Bac2]